MKHHRIKAGILTGAVLLASVFVPGNGNGLFFPALTASAETASQQDTPFQISGKALSATLEREGAVLNITNEKDLKAIVGELNSIAAKEVDGKQNPNTDDVWRATLTLTLKGQKFTYDFVDSANETGCVFQVASSTDGTAVNTISYYRSSRSAKVLRGILDGISAKEPRFPYFLINPDRNFGILLINNGKRTSVDVRLMGDGQEADRMLEALAKVKIVGKTNAAQLGGLVYGVDELRLDSYENRLEYHFYENGIQVKLKEGKGAGKNIFYACTPESLKPLYDLNAKLFAKSKEIVPSWLGLMHYYDTAKISSSKVKAAKTMPDHQVFYALQGIHVFRNSKTEVKALPKKWDYRYDLSFTTGVTYVVEIAGNSLYIQSSDMKGEILRYTLQEDEALQDIKEFTDRNLE